MELSEYLLEVLHQDGEFILYRGRHQRPEGGNPPTILVVTPRAEHPALASVGRMEREYALRAELDPGCAAQPLALVSQQGRTTLVLADPGGEPLDRLLGSPLELKTFLRVAIGLSAALGRLHGRGLIHKDVKPAHVLVDSASGRAWLMGFGIASSVPRMRQSPDPPELITGTLPYMAPEQTGRMNRSIDSRSDLYSLGVTLYEMLTGSLPFTASDPMEWVHSHIARQPPPPSERLENVPVPVSAIIMKLLTKTPEERYQTAAGVERDLRLCLAEWETRSRIDAFSLGAHDTPDQLVIPEKLYGRAVETETLLASFDRVVASGTPELVLVSGYSGIGKSSLVHELHKVLVPPRGLFAWGKADRYKRDLPYAALAQAFQSLVSSLLSKSEAELGIWRNAFHEALGPNGLLMMDLVPQLKLIIGEQQPVPVLPTQDAQCRFQQVLRSFTGVFARPEHPLALFLDDLQWLDAATLDLLENLLTHEDVRHMLIIGAYRDNEVDPTHPLQRKLDTIRKTGVEVQEARLAPLVVNDLEQVIADTLRCAPEQVTELAQLVHGKTGGNPFFAVQFLSTLADERLLTFGHGEARWSWNLDRIHAKGYTDNVVDLMVRKLNRLPAQTLLVLQELACLGNATEFGTLHILYQEVESDIHAQLREAIRAGFIYQSKNSYFFLHDRIQEAAYLSIVADKRTESHLRIGRLLEERTPSDQREERIFEIVNQFNRAADRIISNEERKRVAEFNLIAARRAKLSTAYASALSFLARGRSLLTEESWSTDYELIFSLECLRAECELLTADMESAEDRLSLLAARANCDDDLAPIACLQLTLYAALGRLDRGIEICLQYIRRGGTDWSAHPTSDDVSREYARVWSLLGHRQIEEILDLPLLDNPHILKVLEVLTELITPAVFFDRDLCALVICRIINLSLEHGNSDASCFAYVWFGILAGPRFGNYEGAFKFGQLGFDLLERRSLKRFEARTCLCFAVFAPWTKHVRHCREIVRHSFDVAYRTGDFTYAAYSFTQLITNFLIVGDPLAEAQTEAEKAVEFAKRARVGLVVDIIRSDIQLIRTLRGLTKRFGWFDDEEFDEAEFERHLASNPSLADAGYGYWNLKAQARFLSGDYASAVDASSKAQQLLWAAPALLEFAQFCFYGALSHAGAWNSASPDARKKNFDALIAHHKELEICAEQCPDNFANRAALVGAEIARIEGRELDAERLYEEAIRSSQANGFVHNEAIGNELASRFYAARGFEKIAHMYLRDARYCYLRWGAHGKVGQLDGLNPSLQEERTVAGPRNTIGTPVEHLELATVLKISQAVSGEIVPEKLIDILLRTAIEHAGAERGLLIRPRDGDFQIVAGADSRAGAVAVRLRESAVATDLPEAVVQYAARTQEPVLVNDASASGPFTGDEYIRRQHARSVLCLPLIKQGRLVALLYLENNLAAGVFTPARIAVLNVLASQAAMSLENSRLYRDLEEREAKIRRLVNANIIGIFIWNLDGEILEANEAFLRTVGYDPEDPACGRLRWIDLTPDEWLNRDLQHFLPELKTSGSLQPFEKEFFRKDGSRVPVLVGAAAFDQECSQGVAFVLDLTERKRAEEERTRMLQAEAANRAKDEFLANISHEIRTPMNAILGMTELALESELTEDQQQYLLTVKSSADALLGTINDILDFAKIEAGRLELDRTDFSLASVLGTTLRALGVRAHKKGLELICQQRPDVPDALIGDAGRLRQVLLNLVGNAIKFTKRGEIVVLVENAAQPAAGDEVRLRFAVTDTGIGIPPEKQSKIFRAFEQEDTSTTRKYGGTGLGLTIASRLVALMGGEITVDSEPGRGSTFAFTACFGLATSGRQPESTPTLPSVVLRELPILIVDDNATTRHLLEEWLCGYMMEPTVADNAPAAMAALLRGVAQGRPYPIVLLDGRMPDIDGLTLAAKIREQAELSSTRFILLSSGDRPGDVARARQLGISAKLLKPLQQRELIETILRAMGYEGNPEGLLTKPLLARPPVSQGLVGVPLRILAAEDNVFNRDLLKHMLTRRGLSAVMVVNGEEALARLECEPFDVLLLDVHMPELDGFGVVEAIRKRERMAGGHLPVIALTARSRKEDRERCLRAGMDECITKPYSSADLWAAMDRVLRKNEGEKMTDENRQASPADSSSAMGLIDPRVLLAACGDDPAMLRKMCQTLQSLVPEDLAAVREAFHDQDAPRLREAAHKVYGTLSSFSTVAGDQAADLEDLAARGMLNEVLPFVERLNECATELVRLAGGLTVETLRKLAVSVENPNRATGF